MSEFTIWDRILNTVNNVFTIGPVSRPGLLLLGTTIGVLILVGIVTWRIFSGRKTD